VICSNLGSRGGGGCDDYNEPSVSVKGREFLDLLRVLSVPGGELCSAELVSVCTPHNSVVSVHNGTNTEGC
jgi:hypothetical protein